MSVIVPVTVLSPSAQLPQYATPGAAGMDLVAALERRQTLPAGAHATIPCGIAIALPAGYEAQVRPRSGLAAKHGVTVLNSPGTIDCDYRGEVKVILINHGPLAFEVEPGMRIAQLVIAPVTRVAWEVVESLESTVRGGGGFGHTGT